MSYPNTGCDNLYMIFRKLLGLLVLFLFVETFFFMQLSGAQKIPLKNEVKNQFLFNHHWLESLKKARTNLLQSNNNLLESAKTSNLVLMLYSLRAGARIDSCDAFKRTPLHYAAHKGYDDMVSLLIVYGALIDVQDLWGATPLHDACINGHVNVVLWLLTHGASVNVKNNNGDTPLHSALACQYTERRRVILNLLFAVAGVSSSQIRNNDGLTVVELVEEYVRDNKFVKKLLKKQPKN